MPATSEDTATQSGKVPGKKIMKEKPAISAEPGRGPARATYESPVVKDFGSVGTLTQSGTIMAPESMGMMGLMREMP